MNVNSTVTNENRSEIKEKEGSFFSPNHILMYMIAAISIINIVFKNYFAAGISAIVCLIFFDYHFRKIHSLKSDISKKLHMLEFWAEKKDRSVDLADNCMFEDAIKELIIALKIKETTDIFSDLSALYEELNDFKEALKYCEKALALLELEFENEKIKDIYKAFLYVSKANILGNQKRFEEARSFIDKSIELNKNNPVAYYSLGEIYGHEGDFENEDLYIKKAYSIDPYFPERWNSVPVYKRYIYRNSQKFDKIGEINDFDNKSFHEKEESYKTTVCMDKRYISESKIVQSRKHKTPFYMALCAGIVVAIFTTIYWQGENGFLKLVNYEAVVKNTKSKFETLESLLKYKVVKNQVVNIERSLLVENANGQLFLKPNAEKIIKEVKKFDSILKEREKEIDTFSSSLNMLRIMSSNKGNWDIYKMINSNPVFDLVKSDIEYFSEKFKQEKKPNVIALIMVGGAIKDKYLNRFYENEIKWFNRNILMIVGTDNYEVLNTISNDSMPYLSVEDVKKGNMSKVLFEIVDYLYRRSSKQIYGAVTDITYSGKDIVKLKIDAAVKYEPQDLYLNFFVSLILLLTFLFFLIRYTLYPQYIHIVEK